MSWWRAPQTDETRKAPVERQLTPVERARLTTPDYDPFWIIAQQAVQLATDLPRISMPSTPDTILEDAGLSPTNDSHFLRDMQTSILATEKMMFREYRKRKIFEGMFANPTDLVAPTAVQELEKDSTDPNSTFWQTKDGDTRVLVKPSSGKAALSNASIWVISSSQHAGDYGGGDAIAFKKLLSSSIKSREIGGVSEHLFSEGPATNGNGMGYRANLAAKLKTLGRDHSYISFKAAFVEDTSNYVNNQRANDPQFYAFMWVNHTSIEA